MKLGSVKPEQKGRSLKKGGGSPYELTLRLRRRKIIRSNKDIDEFYELVEESIDRDRW